MKPKIDPVKWIDCVYGNWLWLKYRFSSTMVNSGLRVVSISQWGVFGFRRVSNSVKLYTGTCTYLCAYEMNANAANENKTTLAHLKTVMICYASDSMCVQDVRRDVSMVMNNVTIVTRRGWLSSVRGARRTRSSAHYQSGASAMVAARSHWNKRTRNTVSWRQKNRVHENQLNVKMCVYIKVHWNQKNYCSRRLKPYTNTRIRINVCTTIDYVQELHVGIPLKRTRPIRFLRVWNYVVLNGCHTPYKKKTDTSAIIYVHFTYIRINWI